MGFIADPLVFIGARFKIELLWASSPGFSTSTFRQCECILASDLHAEMRNCARICRPMVGQGARERKVVEITRAMWARAAWRRHQGTETSRLRSI